MGNSPPNPWRYNLQELWREKLTLPLDQWQHALMPNDMVRLIANDEQLGLVIRVDKDNLDTAKLVFVLPISKQFPSFADNLTMIRTLQKALPGAFRGSFIGNLVTRFKFAEKLQAILFEIGGNKFGTHLLYEIPEEYERESREDQQKTTTFTYILGGIATPVNIFAQPCTANDCITIP